ncbi:SHSA8 protein, partial [Rhinopomastus cyanomelas]|nr:SHSA8 protein [Rhinopomastus cyanomelas]
MVLVGIFTKLGLERTQGPQTEMTVSRTLTDLLKQPSHSPSDHVDGLMGSVQVPLGEGLGRGLPRSDTDKPPLNNAVTIGPALGRPHSHNKRLGPPAYAAYTTLKAGVPRHQQKRLHHTFFPTESSTEDFYRLFGGPEVSPASTLP